MKDLKLKLTKEEKAFLKRKENLPNTKFIHYCRHNQNHQLNWWFAIALKGHDTAYLSRGIEESANCIFFTGCC